MSALDLEPGEIFAVPAINAVTRKNDLCWADSPAIYEGRSLGECKVRAVKEGLCMQHYEEIFGHTPDDR